MPAIAVILCLIAFGWFLIPLLAIWFVVAVVVCVGGIALGLLMHSLWKKVSRAV